MPSPVATVFSVLSILCSPYVLMPGKRSSTDGPICALRRASPIAKPLPIALTRLRDVEDVMATILAMGHPVNVP